MYLTAIVLILQFFCTSYSVSALEFSYDKSGGQSLTYQELNWIKPIKSLSGKNLKILWWNIAYNGDVARTVRAKYAPAYSASFTELEFNLFVFATHSDVAPDVIALGEALDPEISVKDHTKLFNWARYNPVRLNPKLEAILKKHYPYSVTYPYVDALPGYGIRILSKQSLQRTELTQIGWYPAKWPQKQKNSYKQEYENADIETKIWDRSAIQIKLDLPQVSPTEKVRTFFLAPTHLCEPWVYIRDHALAFGKYFAGYTLAFSVDHPLAFQVSQLFSALQPHHDDTLIMGDFNIPNLVPAPLGVHVQPEIYKLMTHSYTSAFDDEDPTQFSFPTAYSKQVLEGIPEKLRLDHVFYGKNIKILNTQILKLKGSDHYPVMTVIQ